MSENVRPGTSLPPRGGGAPRGNYRLIRDLIKKLEGIYDAVEGLDCVFLDPSKHGDLSITCKKLHLNDDGTYAQPPWRCFFEPLSLDFFNAHPIDLDQDARYRDDYECSQRVLNELMNDPSSPNYDSATHLSYELHGEFRSYPRKNMGNRLPSLVWNSVWFPSGDVQEDAVFHRVFLDQLYLPNKPAWKPVWTYVPSGGFPHVMLLLIHDVEEDDRLLRSEFLAIVATIITRMDHFASKPVKHVYIPVLVFSFMGNLRGRILQAYFTGDKVVIYKTELFHFAPPERARDLLNIFVRHMANTPIGNTTGRTRSGKTEAPQPSSRDFSLRQRPGNVR